MTLQQQHPPRKRRLWLLIVGAALAVVLALAAVVWVQAGDRIARHLGWESIDYPGPGTGAVKIRVNEGDTGTDVAHTLADHDVVKTPEAVIDLLVKHPDITFDVGTYQLREQMTAQAAIDALRDPANRVQLRVTIPEGFTLSAAIERLSEETGRDTSEFETLAANPSAFGVPEEFPTLEGYLFPATYVFDDGVSAEEILQTMVDRMNQALAQHGVAEADAFRVLNLASIVQREAGANTDDFGRVSRVFVNRLEAGMMLQSDATVAYGTGNFHTVWTSAEERADASNPYNTYAHHGLPVGPVGLPGDVAIQAALNPTPGDWLYFVTVNFETDETRFAATLEEHEENVRALQEWCQTHSEQGGAACD